MFWPCADLQYFYKMAVMRFKCEIQLKIHYKWSPHIGQYVYPPCTDPIYNVFLTGNLIKLKQKAVTI